MTNKMTEQELANLSLPELVAVTREKATNLLVQSGVFSKTKLENLNDDDFFKVLDIVKLPHTRKETA